MRAAVVNDQGEVVNIIVADASIDRLPGFLLVDAPEHVTTQYLWTGEAFVPNAELAAEIAAAEQQFVTEVWETFE